MSEKSPEETLMTTWADAQQKMLVGWLDLLQGTELRKNVQQAQVLLLRWTEAQQQLWQGWFQLVQQLGPLLEAGSQADEHLLSSLQESGWAIINAQTEWVQH